MTLGAGSFYPDPKFAFPRAYIYGIWLSFDLGSVVIWDENRVDFTAPGGVVTGAIVFETRFWEWSSNAYTLDFAIVESWYKVSPSPAEIPLPFALTYYTDPGNALPYLVYEPFSTGGSGAFKHVMPSAPGGYWFQFPTV